MPEPDKDKKPLLGTDYAPQAEEAPIPIPVLVEVPHQPDKGYNISEYDLVSTVGSGGMGVVYKAKHKQIDKTMAIKCLHRELAADPINVQRFAQEVKAASLLTHPNLVSVYDSGVGSDGTPYLVMDYLDGQSLDDVLQHVGQLSLPRFLTIFLQVTDALQHAHAKGIVHRDLKPSNIMVLNEQKSGEDYIKIVDFGIARVIQNVSKDGPKVTQTGDVIGSPNYMSPEQCLGVALDSRSDIYSLGVVMYECLTGKPPFAGDNAIQTIVNHVKDTPPSPSSMRPELGIPETLDVLILSCLEKDPTLRPKSIFEIRCELLQLQKDLNANRQPKLSLTAKLRRRWLRAIANFKKRDRKKQLPPWAFLLVSCLLIAGGVAAWTAASNLSTITAESMIKFHNNNADNMLQRSDHFSPTSAYDSWGQVLNLAKDHNLPIPYQIELNKKIADKAHEKALEDGLDDAGKGILHAAAYRHYARVLELYDQNPYLGTPPASMLSNMSFDIGQQSIHESQPLEIALLRRTLDAYKSEIRHRAPKLETYRELVSTYTSLAESIAIQGHTPEAARLLEECIATVDHAYNKRMATGEAFEAIISLQYKYRELKQFDKAVALDERVLEDMKGGQIKESQMIDDLVQDLASAGKLKQAASWKFTSDDLKAHGE